MQELNFEEIGQAIRASRIDREILKELAACSPEKKEKILKIIRII